MGMINLKIRLYRNQNNKAYKINVHIVIQSYNMLPKTEGKQLNDSLRVGPQTVNWRKLPAKTIIWIVSFNSRTFAMEANH